MKKHKYHVVKNIPVNDGDFRLVEEELEYEQRYGGRAYRKAIVVCSCGQERQAFVTKLGPIGRKTDKNVVCCPECAEKYAEMHGAGQAENLIGRLLLRQRGWKGVKQ